MSYRIAIDGFGRIGRDYLRARPDKNVSERNTNRLVDLTLLLAGRR